MLAEPTIAMRTERSLVSSGILTNYYDQTFGTYSHEWEGVQARVSLANRPDYPRRVDIVAEKFFLGGEFEMDDSNGNHAAAKIKLKKGQLYGNLTLNDIRRVADAGSLMVRDESAIPTKSFRVSPSSKPGALYVLREVASRREETYATAIEVAFALGEILSTPIEI